MKAVRPNVLQNLVRYLTFIYNSYNNIHFPLVYFRKIQKYTIRLENAFVFCQQLFLPRENHRARPYWHKQKTWNSHVIVIYYIFNNYHLIDTYLQDLFFVPFLTTKDI